MPGPTMFDQIRALFHLTPNVEALAFAAVLIAVAIALALVARRQVGCRLDDWAKGRAPYIFDRLSGRIPAITGYATAAIILGAFSGVPGTGVFGRLLVVFAFGIATGALAYHLLRALYLGRAPAWTAAGLVFFGTVAGRLGGLQPLVAGLDSFGMTIGARRLTLLDLVNSALIVALLYLITGAAVRFVGRWIGGIRGVDPSQRVLFQKLGQLALIGVAFFLGLDLLGIDLTAFAIFSGAVGLGIGFGLQKTFGNLIAGLILLMDRSIKPGDVIVVGNSFGQVNKIGVRYVSVLTRDGKEHLIPNEQLMTQEVENWAFSDRNVRLHIPIGVSYNSDIHLAQRLMIEAANASERVLANPKPNVWLRQFGERAVEHDLMVWIEDPENGVGNVQSEILNKVWDLFREHGIELPYPQRELHIRSIDAALELRRVASRPADPEALPHAVEDELGRKRRQNQAE